MIEINLSERDFDYEIQALVNSFFPGQKSVVTASGEERKDGGYSEDILLIVNVSLSMKQISVEVVCKDYSLKRTEEVTGTKDWHKNKDKTTHPYRTYYKNVLKKLIFEQLRDIPAEILSAGHSLKRVIPLWGTMTGVRPTFRKNNPHIRFHPFHRHLQYGIHQNDTEAVCPAHISALL